MPWDAAYVAARAPSRPATAAAIPPARRSAGRKAARAIFAVLMIPQRRSRVPVITVSSCLSFAYCSSSRPGVSVVTSCLAEYFAGIVRGEIGVHATLSLGGLLTGAQETEGRGGDARSE